MHRGALVLGASAAIAASIVVARRLRPSHRLNRLLNGNLRLFSPADRLTLQTLAGDARRAYLLRGWPKPGIKDDQKRRLLASSSAGSADTEAVRLALLEAPQAEARPHRLEEHGDVRVDEFYWLRDDDRKDPAVIAHLEAENAYTKAVLADTVPLQEQLYLQMRGRIKEEDQSAPIRYKGYWYYTRTEEGAQYPKHCRRALPPGTGPPTEGDAMDVSAPEEILLDEAAAAQGFDFYSVSGFSVSHDQRLLAFGLDTVGNEMYTLHVRDLGTGKELLSRPIPATAGSVAWAADNQTLFYVTKDKLDRPYKVWRHVVGTDPDTDVLVFHEEDEAFYVGIGESRTNDVILIHSGEIEGAQ